MTQPIVNLVKQRVQVESYTRRTASGKIVRVSGYNRSTTNLAANWSDEWLEGNAASKDVWEGISFIREEDVPQGTVIDTPGPRDGEPTSPPQTSSPLPRTVAAPPKKTTGRASFTVQEPENDAQRKKEADALEWYQGGRGILPDVHRVITGGKAPTPERDALARLVADGLTSALSRSHLAEDTTLWRGVPHKYGSPEIRRALLAISEGDLIEPSQFVSTSEAEKVAKDFAEDDGTVFEIRAPKGHSALRVPNKTGDRKVGMYHDEREVLLPPTAFKVVSVRRRKNGRAVKQHIVLEPVSVAKSQWNESDHPRNAIGRFIRIGDLVSSPQGSGTVVATGQRGGKVKLRTGRGDVLYVDPKTVTDRKETSLSGMKAASAEDRKRLRIPPAWTDVLVSDDPAAKIIAVGRDGKGREQRRYSAEHADAQAVAKFQRVNRLVRELPAIDEQLANDAMTDDHAAASLLIRKLGLRIGSTRDTGAATPAYGATTLEARHAKVKGDTVSLDFTGKKGVQISLEVTDAQLAKVMKSRMKSKKPTDKLFETSDAQVRGYVSSIAPGFKPKDFRTLVATSEALAQVDKLPTPDNPRALAAAKKAVATHVANLLGNTAKVALDSYIDPTIFGRWDAPLAVAKSVVSIDEREEKLREHYETVSYVTPRGLTVPIPPSNALPNDGPDPDEEDVKKTVLRVLTQPRSL